MLGLRLHRRIARRTTLLFHGGKNNSYYLKYSDHIFIIIHNGHYKLLMLLLLRDCWRFSGFFFRYPQHSSPWDLYSVKKHLHYYRVVVCCCCRFGLRHRRLIGSVKNIMHIFFIEFVLFILTSTTWRGKNILRTNIGHCLRRDQRVFILYCTSNLFSLFFFNIYYYFFFATDQ